MFNIAINGFGRIGRLVFRHLMNMPDLHVVAANDIAPLDNLAYLLRHDSVQDPPQTPVRVDGDRLYWGDRAVHFFSERDPATLPWDELGIDVVVESTGLFTAREDAEAHLRAGASRVVITANGKHPDVTIVMGVNQEMYDPDRHRILASASCTTNCLAPVAMVLDQEFGIVNGVLTTVHAYTGSQSLVDAPNKRWRRGRAAAVSIVPTSTGAAVATSRVLPQLGGRMDGMAMRVPVASGSIIDFVAWTEKPVTVERVNDAMRRAADTDRLRGILGVTDEELVSADIIGMPYSALVDLESTMVVGEHVVKVLAWYDNEWGYALRVGNLVDYIRSRER